jgi:hypothetical protein
MVSHDVQGWFQHHIDPFRFGQFQSIKGMDGLFDAPGLAMLESPKIDTTISCSQLKLIGKVECNLRGILCDDPIEAIKGSQIFMFGVID